MKRNFLNVFFVVLCVFVLLDNTESAEKKVNYDALAIKEDGVYTKLYEFKHERDKRKVVFVVSLPFGEFGYYDEIRTNIRGCRFILYEGGGGEVTRAQVDEAVLEPKLFGGELLGFLGVADEAYPSSLFGRTLLADERKFFDLAERRWIAADGKWVLQNGRDNWARYQEAMRGVIRENALADWVEVAMTMHEMLRAIEFGGETKQNLALWLSYLSGNPQVQKVMKPYRARRAHEKNTVIFTEVFDNLSLFKPSATICIKSGWEAAAGQIEFLRERGFSETKSRYIRAFSVK